MTTLRGWLCVWIVAGSVLAEAQQGNDPQNPRGELETLAAELEAAVRKVSQPGVEPILGNEPARGYYIPGSGAMFVVPPRSLPRERRVVVLAGRARVPTAPVQNDPEYKELEQLLGPEAAREYVSRRQLDERVRREIAQNARQRRLSSPEREAELRRLEQQVEAFQREAERARQEAEQAWAEITQEVQQRLEADAPGSGSKPTSVGGGPSVNLPAPPPWRFWFGTEDPEDERPPEQVVLDVRAAIVAALEAHGALLRNVGSQEQVSVAVDFLPRGLFAGGQRPARTLVVRVKKQFLEERQSGKLTSAQLLAKIEDSGY